MKYLFFFKGHPLLLCCVCFLVCNSRFFERVTYKNKKNLPFHRRIYRRTITRRYFTESCKKITGFCHIHRRLSDGFSDANTDGITDGLSARMSDTCPCARLPTELPTSNTDGLRMSDTCPSARVPTDVTYRRHYRRTTHG